MSSTYDYIPSDEGSSSASDNSLEISESSQSPCRDAAEVDLPDHFFATDRYPRDRKITSYSKTELLIEVLDVLDGTAEYDMLVNSPLGAVFSLPARRCALAGKLVHSFLSCQVNTDNPYELWFVFGGRPIRFSLAEFEQVTGLPCGAYPSKGHIDKVLKWGPSKAPYWYRLIGPSKSTTISDIVAMLKSDKTMPAWRRFQLALVVLVDGVLICATQPPRPTDGTVEMVKYTNFFLNRYPWGRRSFELTIEMVKIGMKVTTHEELVSKLKKKSLVLHGFPVSIQLFLFQSVPALTRMLPSPHDTRPFKGCHLTKLAKIRCYATYDILECENSPEVEVLNISPLPAGPALDPRVGHLLDLINSHHHFTKDD